jgi:hypothetical protein
MKTLQQLRENIEKNQMEYRRISSLNNGVIRGALDIAGIEKDINTDIAEYNARSKKTKYVRGLLEPKNY